MKKRLNITNGDIAAAKRREARIQGEMIPWKDVLHEGPVNASLSLRFGSTDPDARKLVHSAK